jgi:hypothetical protein
MAKDRILPIRNVKSHITVPDGGHFMVLNKAKDVREKMEIYLK